MEGIELINFIDLNLSQKEIILNWRNSNDIRIWMYNNEPIELDSHLGFIESLKNRRDRLYFLVLQNQEPIGVIDFNDITDKSTLMGIYTDPHRRGVGKTLLKTIIDYAFNNLLLDVIISEVFAKNVKAIKLYKEFGFEEVGKKIHSGRDVLVMNLKH
jgi:UDP-4-amino-4,6-dideoxy-N-acetyl-beta-L-altrosamine N-acetyltransferase